MLVLRFRTSFFLLCALACLTGIARGQDRIESLLGDGGVLLQSPSGENLLSIGAEQSLIPASIVKIPLTHVAMTSLGDDFRFTTEFYQNADGDLLVRGLGDPFLVSEEIAIIASALAQQGLTEVHRLVVDDSAFEPNPDLPLETGADDPYAARNSALAVNFNTVNLAWNDAGELVSAEPQTPLTAVARELGADLRQSEAVRINLGDDPMVGLQQAQQLFLHFIEEAGITVSDKEFYREAVNENWNLIYSHASSRPLREILSGMLRYSNNFIANQLFLTLGAQLSGYPATSESAQLALTAQLHELYGEGYGDDPNVLTMVEGSGLGRNQRATAEAMVHILQSFEPYNDLLTETNGVLRKSGTLTGVYNFAGYIPHEGELYPFAILTNQARNNRATILRELVSIVASY